MWAAWQLREPQKDGDGGIQALPTARAVPGKPSRCPQHPRDEEQGMEPAGRAAARGWQPWPQAPPKAPRKVLGGKVRKSPYFFAVSIIHNLCWALPRDTQMEQGWGLKKTFAFQHFFLS